ncbi:hypothetical protein H0R92_02265 [Treponema sp. OMZ 840]|uniref:hypothetical protein n=1 Tax=Treponema sp. OMZ 840 TaxID=244313 RepID=UPI003D8C237C
MNYIGELTTDGYGMAIIPTDLLSEYLTLKKCKAKKLLSYLQKNFDLFQELVEKAKLIPFYRINAFEYHIFASINEEAVIPEGFKEVCRFEKLYLEVGELNKICFSCFDDLNYDFENIKKHITERTEYIKTGPEEIIEPYNYRLCFDIPTGRYEFDLIGLEKIKKTERESKNYGYAFIFKKNENAVNDNLTKCDNEEDTYKFNMPKN